MKIQKFNRPTTESNGTLVLEDVTSEEHDFIFQWVSLVNENYPFEEYLEYVLLKRRMEENDNDPVDLEVEDYENGYTTAAISVSNYNYNFRSLMIFDYDTGKQVATFVNEELIKEAKDGNKI